MALARGKRRAGGIGWVFVVAASLAAAMGAGSCHGGTQGTSRAPSVVLRVGVARASATNPIDGIRQLAQNLSVESLVRLADDGRIEPSLAEKWTLSDDSRTLRMELRPGVKFHDGSHLDPEALATMLPDALRAQFGPAVDDVRAVKAAGDNAIEIQFKRPSPLLLESLEAPIRKPGPSIVGTGPYMVAPDSTTELRANAGYYLGPPNIDEIRIQAFPTLRSAWAELLRDHVDLLYDVGPEALDSLERSTKVTVFTFTRGYQYVIAFNTHAPALRSTSVRRALNMAVDRATLVRETLNNHGIPSSGPIWPRYWALPSMKADLPFDPQRAVEMLSSARQSQRRSEGIRFGCLVPADAVHERIALTVKRQLEAVGIEMNVRSASQDEIYEAERTRKYEAILTEAISGPTLLRLQLLWASNGGANLGFGNATVDVAFERLRHAETDAAFRQAVTGLQQAFTDDPPAIFLAWIDRARAVSKRFAVPQPEPGRDAVSTLRLWTPRNEESLASRN